MADNVEVQVSSLSQYLSTGGKSVKVEICRADVGGWTLEVIDEFGTSTIWDDEFDTEAAALNEAKATIREESIESLVCTDPWVLDRSHR